MKNAMHQTVAMPLAYLALANERVNTAWPPYQQPEDFGYDFRTWVSPYTKGAHTLGGIVLVLQDWASVDGLSGPPDAGIQNIGRAASRQTNQRLEHLLGSVFGLSIAQTYATNAFPFVKPGSMSSRLNTGDVKTAVGQFLSKELAIVKPKLILALGAVTYTALHSADIDCVRLPHPAARIGGVAKHKAAWCTALGQTLTQELKSELKQCSDNAKVLRSTGGEKLR